MRTESVSLHRSVGRFASSFGPAWLVMIADVDAASIITAAETGAMYNYGLIWLLLVLIIPLFFIQEAAGKDWCRYPQGVGGNHQGELFWKNGTFRGRPHGVDGHPKLRD